MNYPTEQFSNETQRANARIWFMEDRCAVIANAASDWAKEYDHRDECVAALLRKLARDIREAIRA